MSAPYYQDDYVTLYHGDCRDSLPSLSSALVLTDPPYPGLVGGYRRAFANVGPQGSPSLAVGDPWGASLEWVDMLPATTLGAIVFCTHHSVAEVAIAFAEWRRVALLTWWKRNAPPTGKNVPRFRSEFAWALARSPGIRWDGLEDTVFDVPSLAGGCFATDEREDHPTQKPIALIGALLSATRPRTVLDPFAGTGTTLVAAKDRGIAAIGIEREESFCEVIARRLSQNILDFGGVA